MVAKLGEIFVRQNQAAREQAGPRGYTRIYEDYDGFYQILCGIVLRHACMMSSLAASW